MDGWVSEWVSGCVKGGEGREARMDGWMDKWREGERAGRGKKGKGRVGEGMSGGWDGEW